MSIIDIDLKSHPSVIYQDKLKDICESLMEYKIHYFSHVRTFRDGTATVLTNHPEILSKGCECQLYHNSRYSKEPQFYSSGYYLWEFDQRTELEAKHLEFLKKNGVGNGFTIIHNDGQVCNFYHFASKPEVTEVNEFFINNIDMFEQFIHYYNVEAETIIRLADLARVYVAPDVKELQSAKRLKLPDELFMCEEEFDERLAKYEAELELVAVAS